MAVSAYNYNRGLLFPKLCLRCLLLSFKTDGVGKEGKKEGGKEERGEVKERGEEERKEKRREKWEELGS